MSTVADDEDVTAHGVHDAEVPSTHDDAPGSSSGFVASLLGRQLAGLRAADADVRTGRPDSIHATRIAARRLRSTLTSYRALLPSDEARRLSGELRWLGAALGPARDAEVLRDRLLAELADTPPELVVGPVADRIRSTLDRDARLGQDAAVQALSSPRHGRIIRDLGALAEGPAASAARPRTARPGTARRAIRRALDADVRLARRRLRAALVPAVAADRDAALHEARKKAKRLHYAAESAATVLGRPAAELADVAHEIQDLLGEHQDSVVARDCLLRLARQAREESEDTFTLGLLHACEQTRRPVRDSAVRAARRRVGRAARRVED
jgi:CHAD domain-containing protein